MGLIERPPEHRHNAFQVAPGSQLRHHPPIVPVDLILRGETVGKDLPTVLYQGSAGIIARTLNGKNNHVKLDFSTSSSVKMLLPSTHGLMIRILGFEGPRVIVKR